MKNILLSILIFLFISPVFAQQINTKQTKAQLASSYYRTKKFEKSATLYMELYEETKMNHYFDYYINSLIGIKDYETAIKALKKAVRKTHNSNMEITLGYVYKEMGDLEKSNETYDKVIQNLSKSKGVIISVGNTFYSRREFEYAKKTYLRGREILEDEMFHSNLANIYAYSRDYENMMNEYMALLKEDDKTFNSVQNRLNALMRYDFDNTLRKTVKNKVVAGIQNNPEIISYNRLLIWIFVLEKDFPRALKNSIALDRRTKTEEVNILKFAINASGISEYAVALEGLAYLKSRKPEASNITDVKRENANIEYLRYINTPPTERINPQQLINTFDQTFDDLGFIPETSSLAQTYAHFLAFYHQSPEAAESVINQALSSRKLNNLQRSKLKTELANINVYNNKLWEASFQYAQIIEGNKENSLGDQVKLQKAKIGYYLGDILWARGQLDALKASTSKLIANDAMELSMLITSNYDLDSIEEPIQLFAQGDLYLYQQKDSLANMVFDSIISTYPGHSLSDKILMRKAQINLRQFNFEQAALIYETILKEYSYSTSADDAIYKLALLNETKLNNTEKAQELYKQILVDFPASIFVADARNRYRFLRGDFEEEQEPLYNDADFITQ